MAHKILYLNRSAEIGGSETSLTLLVKHLDKGSFEPLVVVPGAGPLVERLNDLAVRVLVTPLSGIHLRGGNPLPYMRTVRALVKIIREEKIDLLHTNNDWTNQYGAPAARFCGVRLVCHLRVLTSRSGIIRALLPLADCLIANSRAVAESYLRYRNTPGKVRVIHNGVDLAEYAAEGRGVELRRAMGISDGTFLVGMVGRIIPAKRQDIVLRAVAEIVREYEDLHVAIVGATSVTHQGDAYLDRPYLAKLRQVIQDLKLQNHASFWGFHRDMPAVYEAFDVLAAPCANEPFGRALIEAMAAGKPVVATASGGHLEIVEDGRGGILVPPGDDRRLGEAILGLARNRERARQMGAVGRERAGRLFSIETNVRATERIYRSVLNGQRAVS